MKNGRRDRTGSAQRQQALFFFVVLTKYTNNQTKREKRETEVGRNNTERDLSIKDWYDINHVNQENGEKGGGNRLITPGNADAEEKGEKQELIYSSFFFFSSSFSLCCLHRENHGRLTGALWNKLCNYQKKKRGKSKDRNNSE